MQSNKLFPTLLALTYIIEEHIYCNSAPVNTYLSTFDYSYTNLKHAYYLSRWKQ